MSIFAIHESFCWNVVQSLAHSIWIGAVIGFIALTTNRSLRHQKANTRYWVNLLALFTFAMALPVAYLLVSDQVEVATQSSAILVEQTSPVLSLEPILASANEIEPAQVEAQAPAFEPRASEAWFTGAKPPAWLIRTIAAAYLLGVCYMCFRLAIAIGRSQKILHRAKEITEPNLLTKVEKLSRSLALKFKPLIATSESIAVPIAIGMLRPAVLLPSSFITGLSASEIEHVLRHELAHLRRYDHFMIIFQRLVESLLFFHPVTWYLSGRIHEERENSCDDLACGSGNDRIQYANALVRVAELARSHNSSKADSNTSVALAADGQRPSKLRQRISRLLVVNPSKSSTGTRVLLCFALMLSLSTALAAGHIFASSFTEVTGADDAKEDLTAELLDLLISTSASDASVRTGHFRFKHISRGSDANLTRKQCEELIKNSGPIDNAEKLNQLLQNFSSPTDASKLPFFVKGQLHFDQLRTRESILQFAEAESLHITDEKYSIHWNSKNWQMNILPVRKNHTFQMKKRHFLRPLLPNKGNPFWEATLEKLRNSKITRNEQGYLVESPPGKSGAVEQVLISKKSGYPIYRPSSRNSGALQYRGGWKQDRNGFWFPSVAFGLSFHDGKLQHYSAQLVESVKLNIELPEHLFVMSAPAGTTLVRSGQNTIRLTEDVFDVLSQSQIETASKRRAKRALTEEEKRGANAARDLYSLKEGEVFKRLGPPYPLAQRYVTQMLGHIPERRPNQNPTSRIMGFTEDGAFSHRQILFRGSFNVREVAEYISGLHPSAIEGPEDLLNKLMLGDFVVRNNADNKAVAEAFERVLESEFQSAIDVKINELARPRYVVSGQFKLNDKLCLDTDADGNKEVAVHAGSKRNEHPEKFASGDLENFLNSLSKFINLSISINDVQNLEQKMQWRECLYSDRGNSKDAPFEFKAEKVLEIVTSQTGLKFEKREAKKTVLSIQPVNN